MWSLKLPPSVFPSSHSVLPRYTAHCTILSFYFQPCGLGTGELNNSQENLTLPNLIYVELLVGLSFTNITHPLAKRFLKATSLMVLGFKLA